MDNTLYATSLFNYKRIKTEEVQIGELTMGGDNPIRVQSMTTTNTLDTQASVEQSIRIIEAGGQLVRLTTQGRAEAENMKNIRLELSSRGYITPLVADVHFNPEAALEAAKHVEKVRINPGNFMGEPKRFAAEADTMTDEERNEFLKEKLRPLIEVCKKHHTALRIGVNHGSLSDRIMAKYGDTSEGMVASCMEYIHACEDLGFDQLVISIKSSNTRVMVQTVRLLVATMKTSLKIYPIHLGVTEAGNDMEGRIKSAAGIGALLIDGIGDTIRVSLTEDPEAEVPVAQELVDYIASKEGHELIEPIPVGYYSPYEYKPRRTIAVDGIGGDNRSAIILDKADNYSVADIQHSDGALFFDDGTQRALIGVSEMKDVIGNKWLRLTTDDLTTDLGEVLSVAKDIVIVAEVQTKNPTAELRKIILWLYNMGIDLPVVVHLHYDVAEVETFQLRAACDAGLLFIDGLANGLMLTAPQIEPKVVEEVAENILQATGVRITKAEFVSCPGCGRTLYNLQETTKKIKQTFGHLKGVKIAVMGCIVNGIGEMADADFGYVGAGPGKISLYRNRELVKRAIPEQDAINELVRLVKDEGYWTE